MFNKFAAIIFGLLLLPFSLLQAQSSPIASFSTAQAPPTPLPASVLGASTVINASNSSSNWSLAASIVTFPAITIQNTSATVTVYYLFGAASCSVTTGTGVPLAPGTAVTVWTNQPCIAIITASGSATVNVYQANGPMQLASTNIGTLTAGDVTAALGYTPCNPSLCNLTGTLTSIASPLYGYGNNAVGSYWSVNGFNPTNAPVMGGFSTPSGQATYNTRDQVNAVWGIYDASIPVLENVSSFTSSSVNLSSPVSCSLLHVGSLISTNDTPKYSGLVTSYTCSGGTTSVINVSGWFQVVGSYVSGVTLVGTGTSGYTNGTYQLGNPNGPNGGDYDFPATVTITTSAGQVSTATVSYGGSYNVRPTGNVIIFDGDNTATVTPTWTSVAGNTTPGTPSGTVVILNPNTDIFGLNPVVTYQGNGATSARAIHGGEWDCNNNSGVPETNANSSAVSPLLRCIDIVNLGGSAIGNELILRGPVTNPIVVNTSNSVNMVSLTGNSSSGGYTVNPIGGNTIPIGLSCQPNGGTINDCVRDWDSAGDIYTEFVHGGVNYRYGAQTGSATHPVQSFYTTASGLSFPDINVSYSGGTASTVGAGSMDVQGYLSSSTFSVGSHNVSLPAWGTNGAGLVVSSNTITDTTSTGTVSGNTYMNKLGGQVLNSTNAVTYSVLYGWDIEPPTCTGNATCSAINALHLGGTLNMGAHTINGGGTISGNASGSYALSNQAAGATAPTFSPNGTDFKSGIGAAAAGDVSFICDESTVATECGRLDTSGALTIKALVSCTGLQTSSAGLFSCTVSDKRAKTDRGKFSPQDDLDFILKAPDDHAFLYKEGYGPSGLHYGFFAQDVQKVYPELVHRGPKTVLTPDGELQTDKDEITARTPGAIKALHTEIKDEQMKVAGLSVLVIILAGWNFWLTTKTFNF